MKTEYVHALLATINEGTAVDAALLGLKQTMARRQHEKLYGAVLSEVVRLLESASSNNNAVLRLAKASDRDVLQSAIQATLRDMGAPAEVLVQTVVDETLVGGYVVTYNHTEYDRSYKKALKSLYESIVK